MEKIEQRFEALEKRIAALELALKSGKEGVELYTLMREPYQKHYTLIREPYQKHYTLIREPYQKHYTLVRVGSAGYLEDK